MTIDEAIAEQIDNAKTQREIAFLEERFTEDIFDEKHRLEHLRYADEYEQLAEWLKELKAYREIGTVEECRNSVLDIEKSYNKAIDDFSDKLSKYLGVENAIKYGNKNAEQQRNSYDTLMKYEIADAIDDVAEQLKEGEVNG